MKLFVTVMVLLCCCTLAHAQHDEYVEILSKYIKFPSTKGKEHAAGQYLLELSRERGLETKVLHSDDSTYNFIASLYPLSAGKPNIILLNHIDVVEEGDTTKWSYPPFSGAIAENKIWGRGAMDNKGMAIAQWAALLQFMQEYKGHNLPFNVSLLCVSGEETGSTGAKKVIKDWLDSLNIKFMLGEGGSGVTGVASSAPEVPFFGISASEKTRLVVDLVLEIRSSGHTSVPPDNYAIKDMVQALERITRNKRQLKFNEVNTKSLKQIGRVEKGLRGFVLRHHRFPLFRPLVSSQIKKDPMIASFFSNTIAISDITIPSTQDNQFPIKITATLDCRLLPETDVDQFVECIHKIIKEDKINISLKEEVLSPGRTFDQTYFSLLGNAIKKVYPISENIEIIFPATSDNSLFRNYGITVFGIFPGIFSEYELGRVHSVNEYLAIPVFQNSIKVYYQFLQELADHYSSDDTRLSSDFKQE